MRSALYRRLDVLRAARIRPTGVTKYVHFPISMQSSPLQLISDLS